MISPDPGTITVRDAVVHGAPSGTMRDDVVVVNGILAYVGPARSIPQASGLVLDVPGVSVVPILIDSANRARGLAAEYAMAINTPAAFTVIRRIVASSRIGEMLMIDPREVLAVVLEDRLAAWEGIPAEPYEADPAWIGAWTDPARAMTQYLTADGRYSETRNGRRDAYTGRYWAHREWIAYLDDTGFWAFGQQVDGVIHHGGFVLRRTTP